MQSLLIRNVDDELKTSIERTAKENGRSMQAELLAALEREYGRQKRSYVDILSETRAALDGDTGFELPKRHEPRKTVDFE